MKDLTPTQLELLSEIIAFGKATGFDFANLSKLTLDQLMIDWLEAGKEFRKRIKATDTATLYKMFTELNQVKVVKVWEQSKDNLTLHKTYDIVRENDTTFTILTDAGKERIYKHDNFQFKRL